MHRRHHIDIRVRIGGTTSLGPTRTSGEALFSLDGKIMKIHQNSK